MADIRRSSRRSSAASVVGSAAAKDNKSTDDITDGREPIRKRAKLRAGVREASVAPAKTRKKIKGRLAMLPEMPLDILFEILGRLRPLDLLRIARTTKTFRSTLMSRSSRHIWTASLSNVPGLPPCPPDMTEPQYARLAFEANCSSCSAANVHAVHWELRVRTCSKCSGDVTWIISRSFLKLFPRDLRIIIRKTTASCKIGSGDDEEHIHLMSDVNSVRGAISAIGDDKAALEAYVAERQPLVQDILTHAEACSTWYRAWRKQHADELDAARERRKLAIIQNLKESDWGHHIIRIEQKKDADEFYEGQYDDLCGHKLARLPADLTPRTWNKIKDVFFELLADLKQSSLSKELCKAREKRRDRIEAILHDYALTQPLQDPRPSIRDLFKRDWLDDILDWPVDDAEADDVPNRLFEDLASRIDAYALQWRQSVISTLIARLPPSMEEATKQSPASGGGIGADGAVLRLQLATTLFACQVCKNNKDHPRDNPFAYTNVMAHSCHGPPDLQLWIGGGGSLTWLKGGSSCDLAQISYDPQFAMSASAVVRLCGLDPATATSADMDVLDARLTCVDCYDHGERQRIAMDWRNAVVHHARAPAHGEKVPQLLRLDCADEMAAKALESGPVPLDKGCLRSRARVRAQVYWTCVRCRYVAMPKAFQQHMAAEHGVHAVRPEDCQLSLDYFAIPAPFRNVKIQL